VMLLVVLSYREVVKVYTRAGGSYVVARENFGPRIAQVAAVALLIDYVVTVAVQIAAGTAAVASAFPAIGPYTREISIGVILLMCLGNLRGIKEAGKVFALPTYLFSGSIILMIVIGLVRAVLGTCRSRTCTTSAGSTGSATAPPLTPRFSCSSCWRRRSPTAARR
jgi:amino acid transporter